ncbi:MAG: right-handed parallel beta-helix repeat-containing protein [Paludibacter sp.]
MYSIRTYYNSIIIVFVAILSVAISSCNDDVFSTNPDDKLSFSTDTLTFDTVFTTIGSATAKIMVYNRNNVALKINRISIEGGKNSNFHINVDGSVNENNEFENVEIRANDSMYLFVAVTVDPNQLNSPLLIEESINFENNGVKQKIHLEAFGQDVEILRGVRILRPTTLTATKPYIIYDSLIVAQNRTLKLAPGCKLYFHNNANLIVYGNLNATGTADKPILMRGDRLDNIKFATPFPYNNVSGQWGGIYLLSSAGNHVFDHVNMNSGYVGIYFFNEDRNTLPELKISNCRIHNFLLYGLVVKNGNVLVTNTEISNTSSYSVYLNGGKHTFIHSTIANYFNNSSVQPASRDKKAAVMIMNLNRIAAMESQFYNCIISGSSENEFSLASRFENQYTGSFKNCYIRTQKVLELAQFANIKWFNKNDTVFKSIRYDYEKNTYFNFVLDSVSPARGIADKTIALKYPLDLNGNNRMEDGAPDAGAYEWKSKK